MQKAKPPSRTASLPVRLILRLHRHHNRALGADHQRGAAALAENVLHQGNIRVQTGHRHIRLDGAGKAAAMHALRALTGEEALTYARIRKLDDDFGRQARQRNLLMAMAREVGNCSIPQMISLATTCFDYVKTNLSLLDIISLATKVLPTGISDIQMHAYPQEGEFKYDSADGVSKLFIDPAHGIAKLHGYMYPDTGNYE